MSGPRIILPGSINARLRSWLAGHPDGHERGAFVLFRKFDRHVEGLSTSARYIALEVVELDGDWVESSSPTHLRINLRKLQPLYLRCEQEGLELGFVHNHPVGPSAFSAKDDVNEQKILEGYAGCNGVAVDLVALLLAADHWWARVRTGQTPGDAVTARHVLTLGEKMVLDLQDVSDRDDDTTQRQAAAFGKPFNRKLRSLRAVVIGAGGTGSALATLLARCGIGELIIVDGDQLEDTNLNRVRGYRRTDVGKSKANTLTAYIQSLGLACTVASIPEFLDRSPKAVDALATADVIFGCTDDVAGRDILNQATYYYCLGFVDMGLTGAIGTDEAGQPFLRDHRGRISTVLPEAGACLRCQGVVTEAKLKYERALRERPELADLDPETLRREYYLTGGQESAPGIGPFTSTTADMALASFMNLVRPYRDTPSDLRQDNFWIDFVHLNIYSNLPKIDPDCFCCGGPGLRNASEGRYRLGLPSLGKLTS